MTLKFKNTNNDNLLKFEVEEDCPSVLIKVTNVYIFPFPQAFRKNYTRAFAFKKSVLEQKI